jgi:ribonuclease HI
MRWRRIRPQQGRIWCFCDGSTGALYDGTEMNGRSRNGDQAPARQPSVPGLRLVCAAAAVARADDGSIVDWAWQELPPLTNNEAEYAGLILGLGLARAAGARETVCVLDSEVVVGQMEGRFAVNSAGLRRWHWQACEAARGLPSVRYCLVPRALNRLADGLAGQASMPWAPLLTILHERGGLDSTAKNRSKGDERQDQGEQDREGKNKGRRRE